MKLVVDTNILFSFFWRESFTKKLLLTPIVELYSPNFAVEELKKYSEEIIKKTKIDKSEFFVGLRKLKKIVKFVNRDEYFDFIKGAEKISPDKKDVDFLALCMKLDCFLWSNDLVLKKQDKVRVVSTEEIVELFLEI